MEKLSRSQRYAGLRESMAQDREESTLTKDLSGYQNTLNGFENAFNQQSNPEPVTPAVPVQPAYTAPVQPTPVQPVYTAPVEPVAPVQPAYTAPVEPVAPVQPAVPAFDEGNAVDDIDSLLSALESEVSANAAPVQPQYTAPVEPVAPVQPVETVAPVAPVQPEAPQNNAINSLDDLDLDAFLNETLKEVDEHNKEKGFTILDDIPSNIMNEVKAEKEVQPEPVVEKIIETPVAAPVEVKPEEANYGDTVNVEIGKIMSEISAQSSPEPVKPVAPVIPDTVRNMMDDFLVNDQPENEHPVAVQTLEEDKNTDAVEIMNLADLEKTESLTKTVTFAAPEEEVEEDVDTPNKVLNVLLVILIVALFLVLGFVVYELISANII